ncbi:MAG: hypothetical protein KDC48_09435 [Planctomycetes bacterium]|nr:hypothetical protein [Planctomycetota bacterium]
MREPASGESLVEALRQEARRLQRALAGTDTAAARTAAARLAAHPSFSAGALDDLVARRGEVTRAQILDVLAWEGGHLDWAALLTAELPLLARVTMYVERMSLSLNQWFVDHAEAAAALAGGGYLIPYRKQFVIVDRAGIEELGLDPDDPDWERIGFDWVHPRDPEARLRLAKARFDVMLARGEELP